MISKWQWLLAQIGRTLWIRASLFALLGVGAALLAIAAERLYPGEAPMDLGAEAVNDILNILATSMLAVTTFSLTVMVSAYGSATANIAPRATRLLMQDTTTQNVLGTFLGSFLFSLVGIIALHTEVYGTRGRLVLFLFSLLVVALIAITMLRWIEHLSSLGQMADTTERVEAAIVRAIRSRVDHPSAGTSILFDPRKDIPPEATPVYPDQVGYVMHIDIQVLDEWACENDGQVYITSPPGSFVHQPEPIAWIMPPCEGVSKDVCQCFTLGKERSFDQDPRYGMAVMSDIASRALSTGVNDQGTAIDVLGRVVRVLTCWSEGEELGPLGTLRRRRVHVPPTELADLFDEMFTPIARDGAGTLEVQVKLHEALRMLAQYGSAYRSNAQRHARLALLRAEEALQLEDDKVRVRQLAERTLSLC